MGHSCDYICPDCSYRSVVSEHRDFGWFVIVEPRICNDCRELKNFRIGSPHRPFEPENLDCPMCGSNNTRLWEDHVCPKCAGTMEQGSLYKMWD